VSVFVTHGKIQQGFLFQIGAVFGIARHYGAVNVVFGRKNAVAKTDGQFGIAAGGAFGDIEITARNAPGLGVFPGIQQGVIGRSHVFGGADFFHFVHHFAVHQFVGIETQGIDNKQVSVAGLYTASVEQFSGIAETIAEGGNHRRIGECIEAALEDQVSDQSQVGAGALYGILIHGYRWAAVGFIVIFVIIEGLFKGPVGGGDHGVVPIFVVDFSDAPEQGILLNQHRVVNVVAHGIDTYASAAFAVHIGGIVKVVGLQQEAQFRRFFEVFPEVVFERYIAGESVQNTVGTDPVGRIQFETPKGEFLAAPFAEVDVFSVEHHYTAARIGFGSRMQEIGDVVVNDIPDQGSISRGIYRIGNKIVVRSPHRVRARTGQFVLQAGDLDEFYKAAVGSFGFERGQQVFASQGFVVAVMPVPAVLAGYSRQQQQGQKPGDMFYCFFHSAVINRILLRQPFRLECIQQNSAIIAQVLPF